MLGLACPSDPEWADRAALEIDRVLVDHAHCEMKAATNALALSARCLDHPDVVRALVDLAEEELSHFRRVLDELVRRGLRLTPPNEDVYAVELLRGANATGRDKSVRGAITDRLLVGSLIEARSCERFKLLAAALRKSTDHAIQEDREKRALADFYDELFVAEARHHRTLIDLAETILGDATRVASRLGELACVEADVVARLPKDATIHG